MLQDDYERALNSPSKDYHYESHIRSLLRGIDEDHTGIDERIETAEKNAEGNQPLVSVLEPYKMWRKNNNFKQGAKPAIDLFEEAYDDARKRDWENVAVLSLKYLLQLQLETSQPTAGNTFEEVVEFLDEEYRRDDVHLGNFGDLVRLITDNPGKADESTLEKCLDVCEEQQERLHRKKRYHQERSVLDTIIELRHLLDKEISSTQKRIIESFEEESESRSSHMGTAMVLREGLSKCIGFFDDERERQWKRRVRQENNKAVEKEFKRIELDDEDVEKIVSAGQETTNRIVSWFRKTKQNHTGSYALCELLRSEGHLPSYSAARDSEKGASIMDIVTRVSISQEGDPIDLEYGGVETDSDDRLPNAYTLQLRRYNGLLAHVLYQLIDSQDITENQFIYLLYRTPNLTVSDKAFLLDLIFATFEERSVEAIHLGMSRMEGAVVRLLERSGAAVTAVDDDTIEQSSLGGLFDEVEDRTSEDFGQYFKSRYTETASLNLRNRTNHGQIYYQECTPGAAAILLFDVFRLIVNLDKDSYTSYFGGW